MKIIQRFATLITVAFVMSPAWADSRISVEPFIENNHLSFRIKNDAKQAVTVGSVRFMTQTPGKQAVCASSPATIALTEETPQGTLQTGIAAEQLVACLSAGSTGILIPRLLGVSDSPTKCPTCQSSNAWRTVSLLYDHVQIGKGWKTTKTGSVLLYFDDQ